MTEVPSELISRVAEHTINCDMENEDWQKAIAINGLLAIDSQPFTSTARHLVDRSVKTQTDAGQFSYGSLDYKPWAEGDQPYQGISDPVALGYPVLEIYDRIDDDRYAEAAKRQYEFFETVPRTSNGGIAHHRGPIELWVDSIYMLCPFFARYGELFDETGAFDEVIRQVKLQSHHLQDSHTGLFRHEWREHPNSYPESTFWSRGNGWAVAGILDALDHIPDNHDGRAELVDVFKRLATAVQERQADNGFWHNVIDDPTTPLETSGTLMFAYAFKKGVRKGLLDTEYADSAERAMDACCGVIDDDGAVRRVVGPPGGPNVPFAVTSYGQGWFLLAANQFD